MQAKLNNKKTVAVIGAGISGAACAFQLQSLGFEVQVYEKSRGASGRLSTRRTDAWSADHGAQYFTARNPLFKEEVNRWIESGLVAQWQPKLGFYKEGSWSESFSKDHRFVGTPEMTAPTKYLAKQSSVQYETTICSMEKSNHGWTLSSLEHGPLLKQFDFVVLAIPSPQVEALLKNVTGDVSELSELSSIASASKMKSCWTMMAHFPHQSSFAFDAAFINQEAIAWIARNSTKPQRSGLDYWTVHASPDWSDAHLELEKEDVGQKLLECMKKLGFDTIDAQVTLHRWRYASGGLEPMIECHYSANDGLGLCGDWLHGGRVEGAWLSGIKLANRINA
jgi:predicted NAD/FAD-dependent oxidoreductase